MIHLHVTSWAVGLILLLVAFLLYKQGNAKGGKITHMILRLFYLLIIYSGIHLLVVHYFPINMPQGAEAITKGIIGIWLIGAMEMALVKTSKGKPTKSAWVQFFIALILVFILGYFRLPFGVYLG